MIVRPSKAKAQQRKDLYNALDDKTIGCLHPEQRPTQPSLPTT
jgi:hypothetical protein